MGGRAGGGARGGGGLSDAAIARMAKGTVSSLAMSPEIMNGTIIVDKGFNYNTKEGWVMNARVPTIEAQITADAGPAPAKPTSRKGNAKYVQAYDAYHEKYMAAMSKGVSEYKKVLAKTKDPNTKALLAHKIVTYQGYMKDAVGVKDWIHKKYN